LFTLEYWNFAYDVELVIKWNYKVPRCL
jgi:hypothetical protein